MYFRNPSLKTKRPPIFGDPYAYRRLRSGLGETSRDPHIGGEALWFEARGPPLYSKYVLLNLIRLDLIGGHFGSH